MIGDRLLIVAAYPLSTFALYLVLRRSIELGLGPHGPGLGASLVVAALAASALCGVCCGARHRWTTAVVVVSLTVGAGLLGWGLHGLPDGGFDAQIYHLPSILRLLAGWQPIVEPSDLLLTSHYANGLWTVQAGFDAVFGFESGRAATLVLLVAAAALVAVFLRRRGYGVLPTLALTVVWVANPIALSQAATADADGAVYALALSLFVALLLMIEDRRPVVAGIAASALVVLINAKIAAIFFAGVAIGSACLVLVAVRGRDGAIATLCDRRGVTIMMAGLVAVLFVGWRPYVVNVRDYGTVIYPSRDVLGFYTQDRPGGQIPPRLDGAGQIAKLTALFFGRTSADGPLTYKVPGTWSSGEFRLSPETRIGGFGPWFGAEVILGVAALLWSQRRTMSRRWAMVWGLLLYCLAATVFFPEPWWARFVPLAWGIPLSMVMLAEAARPDRMTTGLLILTLVLAGGNAIVAGRWAVLEALRQGHEIEAKVHTLATDPQPIYLSRGTVWRGMQLAADEVWRERLRAQGKTDVVFLPRDACVHTAFLSADIYRCAPPATPTAIAPRE